MATELKSTKVTFGTQPLQTKQTSSPKTTSKSATFGASAVLASSTKNPFTLPSEDEIFAVRDKERKERKAEAERQKHMKVHEKTTKTSRANARGMLLELQDDADPQLEAATLEAEQASQNLALTQKADSFLEREALAEYISKKREMFLVQYSLGVKRQEIRKLEEVTVQEERKLEEAERALEADAAKFDDFLKENDRAAVEAIKQADGQTKIKLEKVAELKQLQNDLMTMKSEISKNDELIGQLQTYATFLSQLAPKDWQAEHIAKKKARQSRKPGSKRASVDSVTAAMIGNVGRRPSMGVAAAANKFKRAATHAPATSHGAAAQRTMSISSTMDDEIGYDHPLMDDAFDDDEVAEIYFTEASQLLKMFSELEEHNLSLIQNTQELEQTLQDLHDRSKRASATMKHESEFLANQIYQLEAEMREADERTELFKERTQYFTDATSEAQDEEIKQLDAKVAEVYQACIGENEANINTIQLLTNIENKLEELFDKIDKMPADKVLAAEKAKDKQRRLRLREQTLEEQRKQQEERVRKALERAQAEPKKMTGKRLVFRSAPPQVKDTRHKTVNRNTEEEEERKYYFEP